MQGTAEEQFADITAAAHAEALQTIDDILTDNESVDYSAPHDLCNYKYKSRVTISSLPTPTRRTQAALPKVLQTVY